MVPGGGSGEVSRVKTSDRTIKQDYDIVNVSMLFR
jgi:hypothetical protein